MEEENPPKASGGRCVGTVGDVYNLSFERYASIVGFVCVNTEIIVLFCFLERALFFFCGGGVFGTKSRLIYGF